MECYNPIQNVFLANCVTHLIKKKANIYVKCDEPEEEVEVTKLLEGDNKEEINQFKTCLFGRVCNTFAICE
jgi:hypothetical protein